MNNVQTNLMNVAPAPSTAAKTNAAEAVRPASQTGAAADRGAKNPSFDRTLAKLKPSKQDVAEMAEAAGKDSLTASLAASQQAQTRQTDSNDGDSTAKAVETVQPVEKNAAESAAVKAVVANDRAVQTEVFTLTALFASVEEAGGLVPMTALADEAAAQEAATLPAMEESATSETISVLSRDKGVDSAAMVQSQPQSQLQNNAAGISHLDALLALREKPGQDLLQALSSRNLPSQAEMPAAAELTPQTPQVSQVSQAPQTLQMPQVSQTLRLDDANVLVSETVKAAPQMEINLAASMESDAMLPDALLRALAQQPTTAVTAGTSEGLRQTAAVVPLDGETIPLPVAALDVENTSQPLSDMAMEEQDLAQNSSHENFAGLFNEQQKPQVKKMEGNLVFSQAASTQTFDGGAAKPKADSARIFAEAAQTPQIGQEESHASQTNPGVTFRTALQETAEAQPTAPAAPQKDYEVAKQIVEQARLLRLPEETQMVIRLKPEHLGELTLKVSVAASGAVNAAFHTDNAAVRAIIETSMIQLKHELQAQGLKVDNVGVYAGLGDSSLMNGQQDANAHYAQQGSQGSSQGRDIQQALASFEEEQQALAANAQGVLAQDGVDYRI